MSEKYSQYGKECHYSSSGWISGKYSQDDSTYQRDHNRSIRVVAVIFMIMVISALFNLDYAGIVIRFVDMLVGVWRIF